MPSATHDAESIFWAALNIPSPQERARHLDQACGSDQALRAQVEAMVEIEAAGWDVCGIFHSHPAGPPVPSATDVAQALYPEAVYVIVAPDRAGGWQMRGFLIDGGHVREVPLQLVE